MSGIGANAGPFGYLPTTGFMELLPLSAPMDLAGPCAKAFSTATSRLRPSAANGEPVTTHLTIHHTTRKAWHGA